MSLSALPTIKAVVGHPVLQELMGGCSLRCAFPWTTTALVPGYSPQTVYSLDDNDASTAWIGPRMATLRFQFPAKLPAEMNGHTPFYGFDIASGVIRPIKAFKDYARIRKAKLSYNGKPICDVVFADSSCWQHVTFDDIMARQGDTVTLEILDVYPGAKSSDVAVTELVLQGAH